MILLAEAAYEKMPGHWLLASLGKKVLRPGGLYLTRKMLDHLKIDQTDEVVEFAPGLGVTAKMTLQKKPRQYTAVERDEKAANTIKHFLDGKQYQCVIGTAEKTDLPSQSATVVYGEAMLTMQSPRLKDMIVSEARRILKPGGRYAIHEMALTPENLDQEMKETIRKDLVEAIKVNARPLTIPEWKQLLESHGFQVEAVETAPMHLLYPKRMIEDEGVVGVLTILKNVLINGAARKRVFQMRKTFIKYNQYLEGICLVAKLPEA